MATSKSNPTAGESKTDLPREVHDEVVVGDSVQAFTGREPEDVSGDFEIQNPKPRAEVEVSEGNPDGLAVDPEEPELTAQEILDKDTEEESQPGDTWARYIASANHMRGFTRKDQIVLGVPEDQTTDNSEEARPRTLEGKLERGIWFTMQNRWRVQIDEVHPILREYFEEDDSFVVTTY